MDKGPWKTLYGKASTGKIKVWNIWVERSREGNATIVTEHGYEDGKMQRATVKVTSGKNIGRSNETTPYEQAVLETTSKWKKKQDKKYSVDKKDLNKKRPPLPMLAHNYKKRGKDIEYPAYAQPKLNGLRMLSEFLDGGDKVSYNSRGAKKFTTLDHLTKGILSLGLRDTPLDGELFNRELTFQEITSAVKRKQESTARIQFWVYDLILNIPFVERLKLLRSLKLQDPLVLVFTAEVKDEAEMLKMHNQFVQEGYEGTIIRNRAGVYQIDHKSKDLQKYKDFHDEEFEIIGGKQGVGRDEGAVTWKCITKDGNEFDARPKGTMEQRREWWENVDKYVGKHLTVQYQALSDEGTPLFPVGLAIRDGVVDKDGNFKPEL